MSNKIFKPRDITIVSWLIFLAILLVIILGPGAGKTWKWLSDNSAEIASWVQAFGSIAAIWGAFQVLRHQFKQQRLQERRQARRQKKKDDEAERQMRRRYFFQLIDRFASCRSGVDSMLAAIDAGGREWNRFNYTIKSNLELLKSLTIHDVPDLEISVDISNARIRHEGLYILLREFDKVKHDEEKFSSEIISQLKDLSMWLKNSEGVCFKRLSAISTQQEQLTFNDHVLTLKELMRNRA